MFQVERDPDPVEDPNETRACRPSGCVSIHVPMLIIDSEEDWRCPVNQAEELWTTLRMLGREVTFLDRFPGENHELSRSGSPLHRRMRGEIILDFFGEHLVERAPVS